MMLKDTRNGHACTLGRHGRTEIVGCHHDTVLEFDGEDARPGDDGLLCALDAVRKCVFGLIVRSWVDRVGPIWICRIASL